MAEVQTSEVDAKFDRSTWDHDILFADRSPKSKKL
jgi:hypothetical protein